MFNFRNEYSIENFDNLRIKIKWNGNFQDGIIFVNLGILREVDLIFGNFGNIFKPVNRETQVLSTSVPFATGNFPK